MASQLDLFSFMDNRAIELMHEMKFKDALEILEPFCNCLKTDVNFGEQNPDTLRIEYHIGVCLFKMKEFRKSKELFDHVVDEMEKVLGKEHGETLLAKYMWANSLQTLEENIKAISVLKEVCKLFNPVTQIVSGDHATAENVQFYEALKTGLTMNVTVAIEAAERLRLAEKHKEALKILEPLWNWLKSDVNYFGEDHEMTLETKFLIGHSYIQLSEDKKAKEAFESIVKGMEKVHGIEHKKTLSLKFLLALSCEFLNEFKTAFDIFSKLLPLQIKVLGKTDMKTIQSMEAMTRLLGGVVNPLNKLESYEVALEKRVKELEDADKDGNKTNGMEIIALKQFIAYAYEDGWKYEQALGMFKEIFESQKKNLGEDHPATQSTRAHIVKLMSKINAQ